MDKLLSKSIIQPQFVSAKRQKTHLYLLTYSVQDESVLLQQNAVLRCLSNQLYLKKFHFI